MISLKTNIQPPKSLEEAVDKAFESIAQREDIDFISLAKDKEVYLRSQSIVESIRSKCKKLMVLGMGGSSSGGLSIAHALGDRDSLDFWVDTDPDLFRRKLAEMPPLDEVHWLIISKTGTTLEVVTMVNFLSQIYGDQNYSFSDYCTVISGNNNDNPLKLWADENSVPFYSHYKVGGRFSALSENGLVPAYFSGVDIEQLQRGVEKGLNGKLAKELTTLFLQSFAQKEQHTYFWIYDRRLKAFGYWLLQLWSESLGKGSTKLGASPGVVSVPSLCMSTRDQHSLLQQIVEGENRGLVCFFRSSQPTQSDLVLKKNNFKGYEFLINKSFDEVHEAESQATENSLREEGKSVLALDMGEMDASLLGELIMSMQLVVGMMGEILNIDVYNQPGVDRGKQIAKSLLG